MIAIVLLLAGSGLAAVAIQLGRFGAAAQAAAVVPRTATSYVQVDFGAFARQPASWQFARDLPEVKDALASGQTDPKAVVWRLLSPYEPGSLAKLDYESDVKPWLGDRIGMATLPIEKRPAGMFVVQVRDEGRAAETLRKWLSGADCDVTIRSGHAIITRSTDTQGVLSALETGSLAQNEAFAKDFATLGDPGVLAGWADLSALAAARGDVCLGRVVGALSFTADTAALSGRLIGSRWTPLTGGTDLGEWPASTAIAAGVAGLDEALEEAWPTVAPQMEGELRTSGLTKKELVALVGRTISVGGRSVSGGPVGVKLSTDDPKRAQVALKKLSVLPKNGLRPHLEDGLLIAASSVGYQKELVESSERLSGMDTFTKAIPDHDRASGAMYVDVAALLRDTGWKDDRYQDFVGSLRSFGAQLVTDPDGSVSWAVRLVRV